MNYDGWMMWALRTVFKQTAGGGGGISVNIIANERMFILFGTTGPDDYAANRTITSFVQDSTGQIVEIADSESVDDTRTGFPITGEGIGITPDIPAEWNKQISLGIDDRAVLNAAALAQNEEFTIIIRGLIKTTKPTITTTGSGGTVTQTDVYDKVI